VSEDPPAAVIVLAAGGGTRMKSSTPKVLHRIGGRSLVGHVLYAVSALTPDHLVVVVRSGRDDVVPHVQELGAEIGSTPRIADQDEVPGTGRAVQCAFEILPPDLAGTVLITYGDVPLQSTQLLAGMLTQHRRSGDTLTVMTAHLVNPFGYGRILRDASGAVTSVVEEKDATVEQRAISEINSGIFACDLTVLRQTLARLGTDNAQREMYLTDIVALTHQAGHGVGSFATHDLWQNEGVNTRLQLATLGRELNRRVLEYWMAEGVEVVDPATTWVDVTVTLAPDVSLRPGVQLHGATSVETGAKIGPDTTLTDVLVGEGANVVRTHGQGAVLGPNASVGPYAYLRPGTVVGSSGKIGTFVETKKARLADGAKVPHLSYVGDAEIGAGTNIGAGTIFANYDGVDKHETRVGAHARTGANNTFVAPVTIGDGASTGGGTVVRRDVPPGALAVSTGPQRNIENWMQRKRPGSASAEAADAAQARSQAADSDVAATEDEENPA
jgi:bifunctional UDP-N-acetylglucosamine pyrophosphorylase / glucosamine-1-phosphate N-acetyltransferase